MYQEYWQLESKPFEPAGDSCFFFDSESHQGSLHKLRYAIESRRSAALLTGPSGTGKTLLLNRLRQQLGDGVGPFVQVVFPQMSSRDLLVYLAEQLGAPPADPPRYTIEESLRRLERLLQENCRQGRHAVIAIDEAHLLEDSGLLEPLRLLLNLQVDGQPPFTLLLVGQPGLLPALERHTTLDQRIDLKVLLPALSAEASGEYIGHRLRAAGATRDIFSPEALETAYHLTLGIPRKINRLCDLALLVGYAEQHHGIDADSLQAVSDELITVAAVAA